jgi:hypothetical protein
MLSSLDLLAIQNLERSITGGSGTHEWTCRA